MVGEVESVADSSNEVRDFFPRCGASMSVSALRHKSAHNNRGIYFIPSLVLCVNENTHVLLECRSQGGHVP